MQQHCPSKIDGLLFGMWKGVTLLKISHVGKTVNLNCYICRVHLTNMCAVLLLYDNARPHTSWCATQTICNFWWTVLPHPPYSSDHAPSDYHLFVPLKTAGDDTIMLMTGTPCFAGPQCDKIWSSNIFNISINFTRSVPKICLVKTVELK
jgi:hypothetical protein